MRITHSIYVLIALIGLVAGAIATVGIWKMNQVKAELEEIAHEDIPLTENVTKVTLHQLEQAILLERALRGSAVTAGTNVTRDKDALEKLGHQVDGEIKKAEELAEHALSVAHTEEAKKKFRHVFALLKKIEKQHKEYDEHIKQVFEVMEKDDKAALGKLVIKVEHEQEILDKELTAVLIELEEFTKKSTEKALQDEAEGV